MATVSISKSSQIIVGGGNGTSFSTGSNQYAIVTIFADAIFGSVNLNGLGIATVKGSTTYYVGPNSSFSANGSGFPNPTNISGSFVIFGNS